jgi:hypothetical protein
MPAGEMLSVLQAPISINSKITILTNYGYDREIASLLVDKQIEGDEPSTEKID